ncbi:heavy metal-associated domain-containing protein [Luteococcus sp. H138]|uniref:heavy-metal-associated domain-containing protein n=1 Tax=unclassified Luteococcus TaxID=2639923 RepID=UPI00313CF6EE
MITNYTVTGMTCEHCVNHVTEEVEALDGVQAVKVQLEGGSMAVTSDAEIDFAVITEAVAEAGDYTVAKN